MASASTIVHLLGALRRAAGRVILTFLLTLIVVAGIAEAVLYFLFNQTFHLGSHILSAALGVGWAIALSLLVLVVEVVRGLVKGVGDAAKDVEAQIGDAGKLVGGVVQSVEHKIEGR